MWHERKNSVVIVGESLTTTVRTRAIRMDDHWENVESGIGNFGVILEEILGNEREKL